MSMSVGMFDIQHTGDKQWHMPYHLSNQQMQALAQSSDRPTQKNQYLQYIHKMPIKRLQTLSGKSILKTPKEAWYRKQLYNNKKRNDTVGIPKTQPNVW